MIMAAGLVAASFVYRAHSSDPDDDSLTKRDLYQLEKLGGKQNVISVELDSWLTGLWHGRRLAYTIVVISAIACVGSFLAADCLPSDASKQR